MLSSAGAVQHLNASASLKAADREVGLSSMYADTRTGWCDQRMHSRHSNCEQNLLESSAEMRSVTRAAAEQCTLAVQQQQLLTSCKEQHVGWSADSSARGNSSLSSSTIIHQKTQGCAAAGCWSGYSSKPQTAKHTTAQQMPQQQQQHANTANHSNYRPAADGPSKLSGTESQQSDPNWQAEQLLIKDQLLACLIDEKQQLVSCLMQVSAEVLAANAEMKNALKELQGQLQELQHCSDQQQQQQREVPADSGKVDTGLSTAGVAAGVVVKATGVVSAGLVAAGVAGTGTGTTTASAVDAALAAAAANLALLRVTASESAAAGMHAQQTGEQPNFSSLLQQRPRATGVTGSHLAEATSCCFAGTAAVAAPVKPDSLLACCTSSVTGSVPPATGASIVGSSTGSQQQQQRTPALQPNATLPPSTAATAAGMPAAASSTHESGAVCGSCEVEQLVDTNSSTDSAEQDSSSCLFATPCADDCARSVAVQALQTQPAQQQQHLQQKIDVTTCTQQQEKPATHARFAQQLQPLQLPQQQQQQPQLQPLPCTPLVTPAGGGAALSGSSSWAHRSPAPPPKHAAERPAAAGHRAPRRHRSYSCVQQFKFATATAAAPDAGAVVADATAALQAQAEAAAVRPGRSRPTGRLLNFDSAMATALPGCPSHLQPVDPLHLTNSDSTGTLAHIANSSSSGGSSRNFRHQSDHGLETMSCSMQRSLSHSQIPWVDTLGPTTTAGNHSSMQVTQQQQLQGQQQSSKSPSPVRQPTPPGQPPTHGPHFALSPKLAGPHVRLTCPPNSPAPGSAPASAAVTGVAGSSAAAAVAAARGGGGTGAGRCSGCKFMPAPPSDALPHDAYSSEIRFIKHRRRSCTFLGGLAGESSDLDMASRLLSGRCSTKSASAGDSVVGKETAAQELSHRTAGHSLDGGALSSRGRVTALASAQVDGGGAAAFAAAMAAVAAKLQPE